MIQHHRLAGKVSAAINAFEDLMTEELPDSIDALAKARVVLVQSVNAYIAHLGTLAGGTVEKGGSSSWKEAHDHVVELRRRYSSHIGRFNASAIKADWSSYRASCQILMAAMRDHLSGVASRKPTN